MWVRHECLRVNHLGVRPIVDDLRHFNGLIHHLKTHHTPVRIELRDRHLDAPGSNALFLAPVEFRNAFPPRAGIEHPLEIEEIRPASG